MKRYMVAVGLCVMSLLFIVAPANAETPDELVDQGKQLLLQNMDIGGALAKFDQAISQDANCQKAHFWHAVAKAGTNTQVLNTLKDLNILNASNMPLIFDAEGEIKFNPTSVETIIVDDGAATYAGAWTSLQEPADVNNAYDTGCRAHAQGATSDTATWQPSIVTSGYYDVYAWVPYDTQNAADAHYVIGTTTVTANQQMSFGGDHWVGLGSHTFVPGTTITLKADSTTGRVIADAVRLIFRGVITDNSDAGSFSANGGGWQTDTSAGFKGSYLWHAAGTGAQATWTPTVATTGQYQIYAKWVHRSGNAPVAAYTITPAGGTSRTVTIDQSGNADEEVCLGVYQLQAGTGNTVTLASSADGSVVADAIMITPSLPCPNMTEMQDLEIGLVDNQAGGAEIQEALEHLSAIDETFSDTLDMGEGSDPVYLDYGEAKMLEVILNFISVNFNISAAYNMDNADAQKIGFDPNPISFLNVYQDAGTLMPDAETRLGAAMGALENGICAYQDASEFIRNRADDDGLNHLIMFYPPYDPNIYSNAGEWQNEKDASLATEEYARTLMENVYNNLTDHDNYPSIDVLLPNAGNPENIYPDALGRTTQVDVYEFFTNPKDLRVFYDSLPAGNELMMDSFSDPSMGGVLPNMTPADWNWCLGCGPNLNKNPVISWQNETPQVSITWDKAIPEQQSACVRYEVYRGLTTD
ncbi:MAG: hypothetical protein PHS37_03295, partial [Candidatus Omnitrophica bacterium]|nr:hypothetical protein [Candidatus Omnitrophota bacterium]